MRRVLGEFFLDGAKIVFGSIIVGAFVPRGPLQIDLRSIIGGAVVTLLLLLLAITFNSKSASQ